MGLGGHSSDTGENRCFELHHPDEASFSVEDTSPGKAGWWSRLDLITFRLSGNGRDRGPAALILWVGDAENCQIRLFDRVIGETRWHEIGDAIHTQ